MEIDIILDEFSSAQRALELGLMAEEYGFRGLWTMNYGDSRDAFLVLAPLADRSSTIKLGAMAISPHEMHPVKTANLLFTLNEMSNGFMLAGGRSI